MNQMWDMREINNDSKVLQLQQTERTNLLFTKIGRQKSWREKLSLTLNILSGRCLLNLQMVMSKRQLNT